MPADEIKTPTFELLFPVVGKLGDQTSLARDDLLRIKSDLLGTQAELLGMTQGAITIG